MWMMDRFLVTLLEGGDIMCIHMSHVHLQYMVINVQDGVGGGGFGTSKNLESLENLNVFKGGREH